MFSPSRCACIVGAIKIIADLELMLGFRLPLRWLWWFIWVVITPALLTVSDIPVTETKTDTEMIDFSKTQTKTNIEKIFNTNTI